jgi:hypothetical protein
MHVLVIPRSADGEGPHNRECRERGLSQPCYENQHVFVGSLTSFGMTPFWLRRANTHTVNKIGRAFDRVLIAGFADGLLT